MTDTRQRRRPAAGQSADPESGRRPSEPLSRGLLDRLLESPIGAVLDAPWIDGPTLNAIGRVYLPLSRLAAAAEIAGGLEEFACEAGGLSRPRALEEFTRSQLRRQTRLRRRLAAAARDWDAAYFGPAERDQATLDRLERRRLSAGRAYTLARLAFLPLLGTVRVSPVRFDVPTPRAVERALSGAFADPRGLFDPSGQAGKVERSRTLETELGQRYWLRFRLPDSASGSAAWARVHEPRGAPRGLPTIVFVSGICVETDHHGESTAVASRLLREGVRIIELEAPWHGRRRPAGWYSGEPFFARAPLGPLYLFADLVREAAVLTAWSRDSFGGPVGVGGVSMGALAASLTVAHAGEWPAAFKPDAVWLCMTAGEPHLLAFDSAIAKIIGLPGALKAAGWTRATLDSLAVFAGAGGEPGIAPERIVAVLAARDLVTPAASGAALVDGWGVPEDNVFTLDRGHFSAPIAIMRDPVSVRRFAALLGKA